MPSESTEIPRVSSSALMIGLMSERDTDPVQRLAARRQVEAQRRRERLADAARHAEELQRANRMRDGSEAFRRLWQERNQHFTSNTFDRSLVERTTAKVSDAMVRRDNPRVLVVSDHPWRQAFYVEMLRMVGCTCESTRLLAHGVALASPLLHRSSDTSFDLIIVDRPRNAATDAEAAQRLMDFSYSVRIRDAMYRKEHLEVVSNTFLFVLGETDQMPQYLLQAGDGGGGGGAGDGAQDVLCIRRPFYFHLKRIRQLLLPTFVNTQLRLKLYRRDPNFEKIHRMFQASVRKASATEEEMGSVSSEAAARSAASKNGATVSVAAIADTVNTKKNYVTFEGLIEENEDLHNVIITHIRNKARLEEQISTMETSFRETEERYRFSMQGLEGQLRDKDAFVGELTDLAKALKEKLHEAQLKEQQLQQEKTMLLRRSKKKEPVAAGSDVGQVPPSLSGVQSMTTSGRMAPSDSAAAVAAAAAAQTNAALTQQLEALVRKQEEDNRKKNIMLASVRAIAVNDKSSALSKEAKLHAVEVNSKPVQCELWHQSPQEQMEVMKFMALQNGQPIDSTRGKGHRSHIKGAKKDGRPSPFPDKSPGGSRSQSRQMSRQNSRGGSLSRASSSAISSMGEDDFPAAQGNFVELGTYDAIFKAGEGDDVATTLRVENNALKKQLQFFKAQRRMSGGGGGGGVSNSGMPFGQLVGVLPTADVLVPEGTSDVPFLHKKIATLSQQLATMEASMVASHNVPVHPMERTLRPASPPPSQRGGAPLAPEDSADTASLSLLSPGQGNLGDATTSYPAAMHAAEIAALRETISKLEYRVHTLDLSRITTTMQKLVYKGAMLRLLQGGGKDDDSGGTGRRKPRTSDVAVNTTLEGGAATAMWDVGGSLFSPKEMEDRITELSVKVKEGNLMFKESQEQHLQSERHVLEMRLELEKMHNQILELTDQLKTANRKLSTTDASLKERNDRCAELEERLAALQVDMDAKDKALAILRQKPLAVGVGCQTKLSGDVVKKTAMSASTTAMPQSPMRDAMTHHRQAEEGGGSGEAAPRTSGSLAVSSPAGSGTGSLKSPRVPSRSVTPAQQRTSGTMPDTPSSRPSMMGESIPPGAVDSDEAADVALPQPAEEAAVVDNAPTTEEIDLLVTARMAAIALYATAQVDGADIPRKVHEEMVQGLQKECTDYITAMRKLNEVRNAQRVEINELRVMLRDMKEEKNSVPELKALLESITHERAEEQANAKKRERLQRKEFDLLRLKYAHEDDNVAMAAFDIDAFATHTLKAPLDMTNDRSTRFVCRGVELVLGTARRLLAASSNRATLHYHDAEVQTATFRRGSDGAVIDLSDARGRRRSTVSIVDAATTGPEGATPMAHDGGGNAAQRLRVGMRFKGTNPSDDVLPSSSSSIREVFDAAMQTVEVPPYATDTETQCVLLSEAHSTITLPPRKLSHHPHPHGRSARTHAKNGGSAREDLLELSTGADASPRGVGNTSLSQDDPQPSSYRGTTPLQRSSLLHTPGGAARTQSSRPLQRQHATPELADDSSLPSSAVLHSGGYESVPLLEMRSVEVQTDAVAIGGDAVPHVGDMLQWLSQVDAITTLLEQSDDATSCGTETPNISPAPSRLPSVRHTNVARDSRRMTTGVGFPKSVDQQPLLGSDLLAHSCNTNRRASSSVLGEPRPELVLAVRSALSSFVQASEGGAHGHGSALVAFGAVGPPPDVLSAVQSPTTGMPSRLSVKQPFLGPAAIVDPQQPGGGSLLHPFAALPLSARGQRSTTSPLFGVTVATQTTSVDAAVAAAMLGTVPMAGGAGSGAPAGGTTGFALFGGVFDQRSTTAQRAPVDEALLRRALGGQADASVQVSPLRSRRRATSSGSESSDEEELRPALAQDPEGDACFAQAHTQSTEDRTPRGSRIAHESADAANAPALTTPRRRHRKRSQIGVPVAVVQCSAGSQTDPDAHPSKLMPAFVTFHQSFLKLVSRLRGPLCLGPLPAADAVLSNALIAAPSIKLACDAANKNCALVDLMVEKLNVAQRGLRNLGLHGVDLTIAALNILVDEDAGGGAAGGGGEVATQRQVHRHITASDAAMGQRSGGTGLGVGGLPPIKNRPLGPTSALDLVQAANIAMSTCASNAGEVPQLLPPIRAVDEVLLQLPSDDVPLAVHVGRSATGSPTPVLTAVPSAVLGSSLQPPPPQTTTLSPSHNAASRDKAGRPEGHPNLLRHKGPLNGGGPSTEDVGASPRLSLMPIKNAQKKATRR